MLPLVLSGKTYSEMAPKMMELSRRLSIEKLLEKYPYEVSGGQKQRAAIPQRALITEPKIILADEPTGALDSRAAAGVMDLFESINREGQTILMVTHSIQAASHASRVLFIKDGEVYHQIYRGMSGQREMLQKISDTLTLITAGEGRGMKRFFYAKIALTNLKKQTDLFSVSSDLHCNDHDVLYHVQPSTNSVLNKMRGGATMGIVLMFGTVVVGIFAVLFLFYTNSFLVKRREKEFGLYYILGMEKRHISRVMLWETLYTAMISLLLGIACGILFSKLVFWDF